MIQEGQGGQNGITSSTLSYDYADDDLGEGWRRNIRFGIAGFLNLVYRPALKKHQRTQCFLNWMLQPSSPWGRETPTLLGPLERAKPNDNQVTEVSSFKLTQQCM
jgi:hypothetical protein